MFCLSTPIFKLNSKHADSILGLFKAFSTLEQGVEYVQS